MDVLFSLVAIALAISLYDYFYAKNWQQVTSASRNDVVFDKRNKQYGAYAIRRDYNREMSLILLGIVLTITTAYGSYLYFKSDAVVLDVKVFTNDDENITMNPPIPILINFDEKDESLTKKSSHDMVKTPNYVVTDDKTKVVKHDWQDTDKIQGPVDVTGKGNLGFSSPTGGTETGTGTGTKEPKLELPTKDPDVFAEFPGGRDQMMKYFATNLKYPEIPRQMGIQGKCHLQFVINKQGEISDIRILRAVTDCVECDKEAIRVTGKMPKWKPAIKDGQKVDSYFIMPITFSLE